MITQRLDAAQPLHEESLAVYDRIGDRTGQTRLREAMAFFVSLDSAVDLSLGGDAESA